MDEIICALETADRSELLERMIEDVGSGYNVTHFHDRQQRWYRSRERHFRVRVPVQVHVQVYAERLHVHVLQAL